ncbi:MFS transporter [Photobacterium aquae]|uniref:MFS transporter n=1 Tax=Photobacterium aquae TaxID=1195763 RepID=A0A0J1H176_9GAMM|nr:MFS transporter [Photobacterium aquae]KLV05576.1 MFS transporter [Photobacterium aquae]
MATTLSPGTYPENKDDSHRELKRAATASFIGNFVEWFDYASYGYLATVIAVVFFPQTDKTSGLLAAFAVFALSFLVRPLGGIFWGHIGDRYGRKNALSVSIIIMSCATFCIALVPSYQSIGLAAPIILLIARLIQGFSASGEYAGAATFLAEYAPDNKRGLYAAIVPASTAAGLLFGALFVSMLYTLLSAEQLSDWGWRIPFLLAAPFGLIGRYIRVHLEDSPKFRQMEEESANRQKESQVPLKRLLSHHPKEILIAFGVTSLNAVGFYTLLSYMPTYLSAELGLAETTSFLMSTLTLSVYIGLVFYMGVLSDSLGRKRTLTYASIGFIVLTVPLFYLIGSQSLLLIVIAQILLVSMLAMNDGTLACFLTEIFPTPMRYSGFAFTFNCANALFGGTAPLIATWLINVTGSQVAPAYYLVLAAIVALIAMSFSKETCGKPLCD